MSPISPTSTERSWRTWLDVYLDRTAELADKVYASADSEVLLFGDLRHRADRLATALLHAGVRPGGVVAIWMTNSLDFLIAQWAIYRTGNTLLPLYSYYREAELEHALVESRASVLLTSENFGGKVDAAKILGSLLPELHGPKRPDRFAATPHLAAVVSFEGLTNLPGVVPAALLVEGVSIDEASLELIRARTAPTDVMNIMYTSGTTGTPRAGLSMHANNLASIAEWTARARLSFQDKVLVQVPMFTNFGCLYTNGLAMYAGCMLEVTRTFSPSRSLQLIQERGITYIPGTPEMFRMLLDHSDFGASDLRSVRGAHVAGSELDATLMRRIISLAPEAMQAYGMSECGGIATASTINDPLEKRLTTVGRPLAGVRLRIVDPKSGSDLGAGETGEIWFGDAWPGSCVGKGYLHSPEATAAAITPTGWWRTGDLGSLDADGYLTFRGRRKQMLTVGGFNVYPAEIEKHLTALPGVAAAYVVGVADERLGSVPVAFVVPDHPTAVPDPEALKAAMRERVSSQKQPREIWIVGVDTLPRTPSGKVRLAELGELAETMRH